jgi:hypothetical protein
LTGEQMQEAVAANNMQLVAIPPATPDRAAVWYHGDTQVLAADGDVKNLTLALDGRAEQGLAMAEASAIQLPDGVVPSDVELYKSPYRLALNLKIKVKKDRMYIFTKFIAASREGWGGDAKADLAAAKAARSGGFGALLKQHLPRGANYGDLILRSTAMHRRRRSCIPTSTICSQPRRPTRAGPWAPAG